MRSQTHKIPDLIDPQALYSTNGQEAWRVLGIMAEFQTAADRLNGVRPAVSMFGSARIKEGHPYYVAAKSIARKLSDAGFSVISGGGPGLMQAANHGAHAGRAPAIGLNIELPNEQAGNQYQDISLDFRHFFARKMMFVRFASAYVVLPGGLARSAGLPNARRRCRPARAAAFLFFLSAARSGRASSTGSTTRSPAKG